MRTVIANALAAGVVAFALAAAPASASEEKAAADRVVTVYVSGHGGNSLTKKINESHATMEAQGWRFSTMQVHTENGDTEGAWITYVK